jgi:hypothetical protein
LFWLIMPIFTQCWRKHSIIFLRCRST